MTELSVSFSGPYRAVSIRFVDSDGNVRRSGRMPGEGISDLPDDVRKQIEAEWTPEVMQAFADAEAAAAEESANQPVIIPYDEFRARWTNDELAGLFSVRKTAWQVDDYIGLAQAQNSVNLSGKTAAAAKALFVKLAVLTEERAAAIFATG